MLLGEMVGKVRDGRKGGNTGVLAAECMGVFGSIYETIRMNVNREGFFVRVNETSVVEHILEMCGLAGDKAAIEDVH